jgi:hypothetical protein
LAPSAWIDATVPLTIQPAPDQVVRVMVMRAELLPPAVEQEDVAAAQLLGGASDAIARRHFLDLGRFAEPRLRRALALSPSSALPAQSLLNELTSAIASSSVGP